MTNDSQRENDNERLDSTRRSLMLRGLGLLGGAALAQGCVAEAAGSDADEPFDAELNGVVEALVGTTSVVWFDTYAELRTKKGGTTTTSINVAFGRDLALGGMFAWTTDTTTADDNARVIVPNGTTRTGCWKRVRPFDGPLLLSWFGARKGSTEQIRLGNYTALQNAIQAVAGAGGGTIVVDDVYELGHAGWPGVSFGGSDNFSTSVLPVHRLRMIGGRPGCGFRVVADAPAGANPYHFRFKDCESLELDGLSFFSSSTANGIGYFVGSKNLVLRNCLFTGAAGNAYTVQTTGGQNTRVEGCAFESTRGNVFGYVNPGQVETDLSLVGNRFSNCTLYGCAYVCAQRALISNNQFRDHAENGGLFLNASASQSTENITITNNVFENLGSGVRCDFGAWPFLPFKNLTIVSNAFKSIQTYAIGVYPCHGATITSNVIRNSMMDQNGPAVFLGAVRDVIFADNVISWDMEVNGSPTLNQNWALAVGAADPWGETRNVQIRNNSVQGHAYGIQTGSVVVGTGPGAERTHRCSGITIEGNTIRGLIGVETPVGPAGGILVGGLTDEVVISNNLVEPCSWQNCYRASTAKLSGNQFASIGLGYDWDPQTTYYSEENGRKTLRPGTVPPSSLPAGLNAGDLMYNSAPASGSYVGWVYTATGWLGFGSIA